MSTLTRPRVALSARAVALLAALALLATGLAVIAAPAARAAVAPALASAKFAKAGDPSATGTNKFDQVKVTYDQAIVCPANPDTAVKSQFSYTDSDAAVAAAGITGCSGDGQPAVVRLLFPAGTVEGGDAGTLRYEQSDNADQRIKSGLDDTGEQADAVSPDEKRVSGVQISVTDLTVDEGAGTAKVEAKLSAASSTVAKALFVTEDGTATGGRDYQAVTTATDKKARTVKFQPGQTVVKIAIPLLDDKFDERAETFTVKLSDPVGAVLGRRTATVTITDNDPAPRLAVGDARRKEGDKGDRNKVRFVVRLDHASAKRVRFDWRTRLLDGRNAASSKDFFAADGSRTIEAGKTRVAVKVTIRGDNRLEPNERFRLTLSNVKRARSAKADRRATGTIVNDD